MDSKKDKTINKGQKDTKETIKDNKGLHLRSVSNLSSLFGKTQKISTACYILTNHINENDPLKRRIRECSISLIKDIFSTNEDSFKNRTNFFTLAEKSISELIVLFDIVFLIKLVSESNYNIMCRELMGTREAVIKLQAETDKKPFLPESFFSEETSITEGDKISSSALAEIKERLKNNVPRQISGYRHKGQDNVLYKSINNGIKSGNKEERKNTILDFVRENNEVGIKEICNHLAGVGGKTVQRELTKMVEEGIIVRTGNKRWSRYSLV